MPPVDRNNPVRAKSSDSRVSFIEFQREFPDDAACLEWLWRSRFSPDGEHADCPKCKNGRTFRRYKTSQQRQSWTCTACGHHIHPTAGTIFHKSSTSLQYWFYAIYLMSSTRCGISAKQLERELGCNYKTALRMLRKIRSELMAQDDTPLSGKVEADETFIGGKPRESSRREAAKHGWNMQTAYWNRKPIVFAAVERRGRVRATVVPSSSAPALGTKVREFIVPGSILFTDEWGAYKSVGKGYQHRRIRHRERIYVEGDTHTQSVEGFFGLFKTGVRGTHHAISTRWLPTYLNEWVWRYNHRDDDEAQFRSLLACAASK